MSRMGARRWAEYLFAVAAVSGTAIIVYLGHGFLSEFSRTSIILAAVVACATLGGLGPGLVATAIGVVAADLLLVPKVLQFSLHSDDFAGLLFFIGAGVFASVVSGRIRRIHQREADQRAARQIAQDALGASEHRFRQLMEQAADAIFIADRQGTYVDLNEGACRLLGYSRDELIGKRIADIIPPRDHFRLVEFKEKLETGESHVAQWLLVRKDGSTVPVEISAKIVSDTLCQAIARDITLRKQTEQDLIRAGMEADRLRREADSARQAAEQAKEDAESASKAKDHFLAVLSHELRTPLTPVVTGVQLLETDPETSFSADAREILAMIRRNIDLETRLIDDLLDLTRISRGKLRLDPTTIDVHTKLKNVINICESEVKGKRLTLALDLAADRHYAQADGARLQQVFWNLLKNAIKFTPEGGQISVATADAGNDRISVQITDTGVGIDPAVLPLLFTAFEQGEKSTNRNFGGLGLGLAISKALVTLHGGTIHAHSQGKNRGATFTVNLPAMDAPILFSDIPSEAGPAAASDRRLSILVVEDHPDTANALERLLRGEGHAVHTTDCVATALAVADSQEFDVLISDIGLPDGSGLDLMRQLRARYNHDAKPIKGIVLSGFGMEEDVKKSQEAGFLEHLTKPINFARLRGTLEKITAE